MTCLSYHSLSVPLTDLGVDYTQPKWLFFYFGPFSLALEPTIKGEDGLILEELRVCAANDVSQRLIWGRYSGARRKEVWLNQATIFIVQSLKVI